MKAKKQRYELYVLKQSLTRQQVGSDEVAWKSRVLATSRSEALQLCMNDLRPLVCAAQTAGYKYLSVFCGTASPTSRASRLDPFRISIA